MERLILLLKVSRPLGWVIAPLVFLTGLKFSGAGLSPLNISQMLLLSIPFSILLYGVNDIYDHESDMLNPRKKLIEGIKLEQRHHSFVKRTGLIAGLILIMNSLLIGNLSNNAGILLLIFFSYFYSAPPLRFKERPPLDSFSNGAIFFFVFSAGYSFGGPITTIPIKIYLVAACVMGVHSFSTIMDYGVDKKISDNTFAVVFGKRLASLFALLIFIITFFYAGINTKVINSYLFFCSVFFLLNLIYPSEKLASLYFKLISLGFIVTATVFLI